MIKYDCNRRIDNMKCLELLKAATRLSRKEKLDGMISPEPPSEVKVKSPGCGKLEVDDGEDGDHLIKIHFNCNHNIPKERW